MKRIDLHSVIHLFLCASLAFCFSFKFLLPPLIIFMVLNVLMSPGIGMKWKNIQDKKYVILFIAPYLLYLIGMSYSENQHYGWADLQTKLSLLLFPLLFALNQTNANQNLIIKKSLLAGIIAASVVLLIRATYIFFTLHENHFFYVDFSRFLHPSYFGLAIDLGLILLLFDRSLQLAPALKITMSIFFVLIIFLLASKIALLCTLLLLLAFAIVRMIQLKKYFLGIATIVVSLVSITMLLLLTPELRGRIQNAIDAIDAKNIDKTNAESNAVRILVWKAAREVLSEHAVIGVGTGDVKDELFKKYAELGFTGALSHKLNAHNQFLQTGVALGCVGLLLFLLSLILPAIHSYTRKNYLFVFMVLVIAINLMTESMLEAEAGVIFISFALSFLFFSSNKELINFEQKIV